MKITPVTFYKTDKNSEKLFLVNKNHNAFGMKMILGDSEKELAKDIFRRMDGANTTRLRAFRNLLALIETFNEKLINEKAVEAMDKEFSDILPPQNVFPNYENGILKLGLKQVEEDNSTRLKFIITSDDNSIAAESPESLDNSLKIFIAHPEGCYNRVKTSISNTIIKYFKNWLEEEPKIMEDLDIKAKQEFDSL